jgi:hypothetical protein
MQDLMDNREKRIAFAFMAIEGRKSHLSRFRQPKINHEYILIIFTLMFFILLFFIIK